MAKRKTRFGERKSVAYGYVGKWRDGTLGWAMPDHLSHGANRPKNRHYLSDTDKLYLCKITVEVVTDKNGRVITRRHKP